mgnify:CR=1 FL=1
MTSSTGDSATHYGFTGERTDPSGLTYLRARYYNPTDGRFMNRDTWSGDVNKPLSLNRWLYSYANPIKYVDPSGYKPCFDPSFNVDLVGDWPDLATNAVCDAVFYVGKKLSTVYGGSYSTAFNRIYGYVNFKWDTNCYGCRPLWCINNNASTGNVPDTETSCVPKGGVTDTAH